MRTASRLPLERFLAIDRVVRLGEYPNSTTLAHQLEVSPRTIQRDIEFLRERLFAPLEYDEKRHGYHYNDLAYRLPEIPLTEGELVAILLAGQVLEQHRGTPYAEELGRIFRKLTESLSEPISINLESLNQSLSIRNSVVSPVDPNLFSTLISAVKNHRCLILRYWSASKDEETTRRIDPYHLASVDGVWYLVGYCHLRDEVRMFLPGRILHAELMEDDFERPSDFDIVRFLADSFSVLRGGPDERHRVRLRFSGQAVKYVRERTWHPSQTIEVEDEGRLLLTVEVSHLREVERWCLSWGRDCEVLEPDDLRRRVENELSQALAHYASVSDQPAGPPRPSKRVKPRSGS